MKDYLELLPEADHQTILKQRQENDKLLSSDKKGVLTYRRLWESIAHLRAGHLDTKGDKVVVGDINEISPEDHQLLYQVLRKLMPWRKGPYQIFGIDIDAEWQSNRKWDRILPLLPDLKNKIVADIGCSNGYYMFRMSHYRPRTVIGFEPYLHHYFTFRILNSLAALKTLQAELLGVEHLDLYKNSFDVIFLMGVIYHRVSPLESLQEVYKSLKPEGILILESQAIPGEDPVALFPAKRYAKVPGTYFVPTAACLQNWLTRAGFSVVKTFCCHPMSKEEQRTTEWMTFESFQDFMDKNNPGLTVEGYPAPWRVFLKASKY
ncbi:MAG: tRNA 5-methoxyuridine(34)/uridine 5-oxyacetic acid(34) synthase CmoB [Thermodesulfobacteriota bacterium]